MPIDLNQFDNKEYDWREEELLRSSESSESGHTDMDLDSLSTDNQAAGQGRKKSRGNGYFQPVLPLQAATKQPQVVALHFSLHCSLHCSI